MATPYRLPGGEIAGVMCRWDSPEGSERSKEILPLTCSEGKWKFNGDGWPDPRPLLNADKLADNPDALIILVEGEKCVYHLERTLPQEPVTIVTTWPHGDQSWQKADWNLLKGYSVLVWPDNDPAGFKAARGIVHRLMDVGGENPIAHNVLVLIPPKDRPAKWDVADGILSGELTEGNIREFIAANRVHWTVFDDLAWRMEEGGKKKLPRPKKRQRPVELVRPAQRPEGTAPLPPLVNPESEGFPFKCLGYQGDSFYFLPMRQLQVKAMKAAEMRPLNLLTLAPKEFWSGAYPGDKGPRWMDATNDIIIHCQRAGIYNPEKVRGRGAWIDGPDHSIVVNIGDRLIVDGKETSFLEYKSRYVYSADAALPRPDPDPLSVDEAILALNIAREFRWEKTSMAYLFAGWCVIAPICGALKWRPHIWITGPSQSGKSTALNMYAHRLMSSWSLFFQHETTSAGIRQTIKNDARPVLFDESEGGEVGARNRMEQVLSLIRSSSTDTEAQLVKGTANHQAESFRIRSSFALASIFVSLKNKADESRFTVVELKGIKGNQTDEEKMASLDHWKHLERAMRETFTEQYSARLLARTLSMIPEIRESTEAFTDALHEAFGSARVADQYAPLLAGAYSLRHDEAATREKALEIIRSEQWKEQIEVAYDASEDCDKCLGYMAQALIRVDDGGKPGTLSIAELVRLSLRHGIHENIMPEHAASTLSRHGLKVDTETERVLIANQHSAIERIMEKTNYPRNWNHILKNAEGAEKSSSVRFGRNVGRGLWLPAKSILEAAGVEMRNGNSVAMTPDEEVPF